MNWPPKSEFSKPINPVFVLDNGLRVPMDLRYAGMSSFGPAWEPVIEGQVFQLMPRIVAMDADDWPPDCAIKFPNTDPAWVHRLMGNSPIIKRAMQNQKIIVKEKEVNHVPGQLD